MKKRRIIIFVLAAFMAIACCASCKKQDVDAAKWATAIFEDSLEKLVAEGVLKYKPEGYIFTFTKTDDDVSVPFTDAQAARQYVDNSANIGGKLVYGYWQEQSGFVVYENEHPSKEKPRYMPALPKSNVPLYAEVDPLQFANHIDECDTLIFYGGFESSRNVDAYLEGVDRVGITTLVFVIDVQKKEVQHIEVIGTDIPEMATDLSHTTGDILKDEAEEYILGLLQGQ